METRVTGGPNWQMELRTPGTAITPHRYATHPESLLAPSWPPKLCLLLVPTNKSC